jgi:sugar lactone lactonase YvrE
MFGALALAVIAGGAVAAAPNPNSYPDFGYRVDEGWAKLPPGRTWGGVSAVDMDRDGRSVWVVDRCGSADGGCATSHLDPVMEFDAQGRLMRHWGAGQFQYPHGMFVDAQDNIWTADGIAHDGAAGQVVRKWSRDGKLLLTLGTFGVGGGDTAHFNGVSDVLVAPDGSIFVADGHEDRIGVTNDRILKFDARGKFLRQWGSKGDAPGQFNPPHGLAMDSAGRLYVADRANNRIQIFDQAGKFIAQWRQFGRPSGLYIDKHDTIYVADSLSSATNNPGFRNGIRWGSVKDGKVVGFIPWGEYNTIEGVAVDDAGNIYAGFTNTKNFRRFVKK